MAAVAVPTLTGRRVGTRRLKVYTAAPFAKQPYVRMIAAWLRAHGFNCDPRWLHESSKENEDPLKAAQDDLRDLYDADILIAFTEPPSADPTLNRGGRYVEFGYALALGKRIIVVGPKENIFAWLPEVEVFDSWPQAAAKLTASLRLQ